MDFSHPLYEYGFLISGIGLAIVFLNPFFKVQEDMVYIVERFGKFHRLANAGLQWKFPLMEQLKGPLTLRAEQIEVTAEGKTLDDIFMTITVSLHYRLNSRKIYAAYYALSDTHSYLNTIVLDTIRSDLPRLKMDDFFNEQDSFANALVSSLKTKMDEIGIDMLDAFIIDIQPDAKVKAAMNTINEAIRLKTAAQEQGEAEKIKKQSQLKLEMETKHLQGKGIARQWEEILKQLHTSLEDFKKAYPKVDPESLIKMLMRLHYLETLRDIALHHQEKSADSDGKASDQTQVIRDAVIGSLTGVTKDMLEKVIPGNSAKDGEGDK